MATPVCPPSIVRIFGAKLMCNQGVARNPKIQLSHLGQTLIVIHGIEKCLMYHCTISFTIHCWSNRLGSERCSLFHGILHYQQCLQLFSFLLPLPLEIRFYQSWWLAQAHFLKRLLQPAISPSCSWVNVTHKNRGRFDGEIKKKKEGQRGEVGVIGRDGGGVGGYERYPPPPSDTNECWG